MLFSENPSRFIIGTGNPEKLENYLEKIKNLRFSKIGTSVAKIRTEKIIFKSRNRKVLDIDIANAQRSYQSISRQ
jgi:hypothetical protein